MPFSPYSGSLLRLAVTTAAICALLAAAFVSWQNSAAPRRSLAANLGLPALSAR
jgi:hypothetical protein